MLQKPHQACSYLSSVWIKNLIHFIVRKNNIVLDNTLHFNIQLRNDKWIMDKLARGSLSLNQFTHLNAYRLYLNIIHLSEMIYPDRKTVNHNYLVGVKPTYPISKWKWPNQTYPSIKACKLWNTIIFRVFNIQNNKILGPYSRLKEWLTPVSQRTMSHQWYYSPIHQEMFYTDSDKVTRYFTDKVHYNKMKLNLDSKTEIE